MMLKKFLALFILIFVLGCTMPGSKQSLTEGVRINQFSFSYPEIYDNGDAELLINFQNVGAKTMEGNTHTYVYGPSIGEAGWMVKSIPLDWSVGQNRLEWVAPSDKFLPPDPEQNFMGDSIFSTISLIPYNLPEGHNDIYTFYLRICYPYTTTASASITSTSPDEYTQEVKKTKDKAETINSAGPIQIQLETKSDIRAHYIENGYEIPLVFKIKDVGGGFVTENNECNLNVERSDRDKVEVQIEIDGKGNNIFCGGVSNIQVVKLINGEGMLYCRVRFLNENPKSEYHIVTTSKYKYYVDKYTTITVKDSFTDVDTA